MLLEILEFLVRGALLGAIYGLLAYPVSLLFVTTESVDLAVGAYAVLAATVCMAVSATLGIPLGIALGIFSAVLASLVVGALSLSINRGSKPDPLVMVLATFGFATVLESIVLTLYGKDPMVRQPFVNFWQMGEIRVSPQAAINLATGLVLLTALYVWLYRTSFGRDMRACAANPGAAALAGIPVQRISLATYMVGGLLAGIAGILILYTTGTSYSAGLGLTISGFGAAVLFGLHSPLRGFAGGVVIGVVQALSAGYLSGGWGTAAPLLFILIVLASGRANFSHIVGGRA
ncbi:MAG: branched-chain amino acid ABC transporter permease [Rhodocyclaceae bacterium]|nr:MAG: branched-chain amino acid ABC transporter permease [Rhodocyclaceae bacterium]